MRFSGAIVSNGLAACVDSAGEKVVPVVAGGQENFCLRGLALDKLPEIASVAYYAAGRLRNRGDQQFASEKKLFIVGVCLILIGIFQIQAAH